MSQTKSTGNTRQLEKLMGIERALQSYRLQIKGLRHAISKTKCRLKGATNEVVHRRFTTDLHNYETQLKDLLEKEMWAKFQIHKLKMALSCNAKGSLKHNPFASLAY